MHNLQKKIDDLDKAGFKRLTELLGSYLFPNFTLEIIHVQGSPSAHPASIAVVTIDLAKNGFKKEFYQSRHLKIAFSDFILRIFGEGIVTFARQCRGKDGSGSFHTVKYGQIMVERSAVVVDSGLLEVRFIISFPSSKSRGGVLDAKQARIMLFEELVSIVDYTLKYSNYDKPRQKRMAEHLQTAADQFLIRQYLEKKNLIAFVANGSLLPRKSGVENLPLTEEKAVKFESPASLEIAIPLEGERHITGMGIRSGVTVITGGGFHGKSTLLKALVQGVYNHIPGDGREYVVTRDDGSFIRAEEGRSVAGTDISTFIGDIPSGIDTSFFVSGNASGSTSQATNIMESVEAGSRLLFFDEDTCATNFMARDELIGQIIPRQKEPIKPLRDIARALWKGYAISAIFVVGGLGSYLSIADTVLCLDRYRVEDISKKVRDLTGIVQEKWQPVSLPAAGRKIGRGNFNPVYYNERMKKTVAVRYKPLRENFRRIEYGNDRIDLDCLPQLVEAAQSEAIGAMIYYLRKETEKVAAKSFDLMALVDKLYLELAQKGLDLLPFRYKGLFSLPRKIEFLAALNRMRSLQVLS